MAKETFRVTDVAQYESPKTCALLGILASGKVQNSINLGENFSPFPFIKKNKQRNLVHYLLIISHWFN